MNIRRRYSGNHYLPEVEHDYKQTSQIKKYKQANSINKQIVTGNQQQPKCHKSQGFVTHPYPVQPELLFGHAGNKSRKSSTQTITFSPATYQLYVWLLNVFSL